MFLNQFSEANPNLTHLRWTHNLNFNTISNDLVQWFSHWMQHNHLWIFLNSLVNYTSYLLIRIFQDKAWIETHKSPPMTLRPSCDGESLISPEPALSKAPRDSSVSLVDSDP